MRSKTQVSPWGWKGLLLALLAQAACGADRLRWPWFA